MYHVIAVALFLHVLALSIWIGGMVFAHFCLSPALADLSPQLRLPVVAGVLGRFFNWVSAAVVVLLVTGGFLFSQFGGAHAPLPALVMAALGVLMMLNFGHIRFALYPRIRRAVQSERWPDGAAAVASVRTLVLVNLVLGVVTMAAGVLAQGF